MVVGCGRGLPSSSRRRVVRLSPSRGAVAFWSVSPRVPPVDKERARDAACRELRLARELDAFLEDDVGFHSTLPVLDAARACVAEGEAEGAAAGGDALDHSVQRMAQTCASVVESRLGGKPAARRFLADFAAWVRGEAGSVPPSARGGGGGSDVTMTSGGGGGGGDGGSGGGGDCGNGGGAVPVELLVERGVEDRGSSRRPRGSTLGARLRARLEAGTVSDTQAGAPSGLTTPATAGGRLRARLEAERSDKQAGAPLATPATAVGGSALSLA